MRKFSTAFKEGVLLRLDAGETLADLSLEFGIRQNLLYEWRAAWLRHGAAGLNRKRGPKLARKFFGARSPWPRRQLQMAGLAEAATLRAG